MAESICDPHKCTACQGCKSICPRQCISMRDNADNETAYAVKDLSNCVSCGLCEKMCPQNDQLELHIIKHCYCAWSLNNETRIASASGGIAAEIYKYIIGNHGKAAGVRISKELKPEFVLADSFETIKGFQNSKYVYADSGMIYKQVGNSLLEGEEVVFIGLPCQVAALSKYIKTKKIDDEKLITCDLICHGIAPEVFLEQHIRYLENKHHTKAEEIHFRDPKFGTKNFYFTLRGSKGLFYKRTVGDTDAYQIGYHNGLIYRENCYHCTYAQKNRVGDITLGDFFRLGKLSDISYSKDNVSCVLVNTEKGKALLDKLQKNHQIFMDERPIEEETLYEPQLKHPTAISVQRKQFIENYSKSHDFESSMRKVAFKTMISNKVKKVFHYYEAKNILRKILRR